MIGDEWAFSFLELSYCGIGDFLDFSFGQIIHC